MSAQFATTQWSVVLAARDGAGTEARKALSALCQAYWFPLYAYLRSRGYSAEEARDLTQGYFVHLLEKEILEGIDPAKGRFRSFLLASLKNFLSHERDKAAAVKRGGQVRTVSLDDDEAENRYGREPVSALTPDQVFERRWGLTVMERAMDRLAAETSAAARRPETFDRLQPYLTGSEPAIPYAEVAAELGMTEGAVKTAVHRLRQGYGRCLRQEIGETLADPGSIDQELRHLLEVVRPWESPTAP